MNAPTTTAELLVSQFAPAVLLNIKQVSQVTGQAEQTIRNLISEGSVQHVPTDAGHPSQSVS